MADRPDTFRRRSTILYSSEFRAASTQPSQSGSAALDLAEPFHPNRAPIVIGPRRRRVPTIFITHVKPNSNNPFATTKPSSLQSGRTSPFDFIRISKEGAKRLFRLIVRSSPPPVASADIASTGSLVATAPDNTQQSDNNSVEQPAQLAAQEETDAASPQSAATGAVEVASTLTSTLTSTSTPTPTPTPTSIPTSIPAPLELPATPSAAVLEETPQLPIERSRPSTGSSASTVVPDNRPRAGSSDTSASVEPVAPEIVGELQSSNPQPPSQTAEASSSRPSPALLRRRAILASHTTSRRGSAPAITMDAVHRLSWSGMPSDVPMPTNKDIPLTSEKPAAATSTCSVTISLAEPVLFVNGFEPAEFTNRAPSILRGSLILRVLKATKIKTITLSFKGRARTDWPEGIPPKKTEFREEHDIMRHTWPFFNAQFPTAEYGHGADSARIHNDAKRHSTAAPEYHVSALASAVGNINFLKAPDIRVNNRLSLQANHSRSASRDDDGGSVNQKGYRTFQPGDYVYNFELPFENCLPETITADLGHVRYELEALIERAGAFRPPLLGTKEVLVVRAPGESSLEHIEPIAISKNWEDQLHYDIVISGKSFPLGAQVPIAFKLTPLAKVKIHRIRIVVTENVEYFCKNRHVRRMEPTKKIQLFEKKVDEPSTSTFPGSSAQIISGGGLDIDQRRMARNTGLEALGNGYDSLLGDLSGEHNIGPTEMEIRVQLPGCNAPASQRLLYDTSYQNIQVHHWIKVIMRLSRADTEDPGRRRHFEISIDSPFHIFSCRAKQEYTALPAYSSNQAHDADSQGLCGCPIVTPPYPRRSHQHSVSVPPTVSIDLPAPPQAAHIDGTSLHAPSSTDLRRMSQPLPRPMHLIRQISTAPPPFEDSDPPPPLLTPPPLYGDVIQGEGLADYFRRFSDAFEDDETRQREQESRARMLLPLTPGGRVSRSMDVPRTPG